MGSPCHSHYTSLWELICTKSEVMDPLMLTVALDADIVSYSLLPMLVNCSAVCSRCITYTLSTHDPRTTLSTGTQDRYQTLFFSNLSLGQLVSMHLFWNPLGHLIKHHSPGEAILAWGLAQYLPGASSSVPPHRLHRPSGGLEHAHATPYECRERAGMWVKKMCSHPSLYQTRCAACSLPSLDCFHSFQIEGVQSRKPSCYTPGKEKAGGLHRTDDKNCTQSSKWSHIIDLDKDTVILAVFLLYYDYSACLMCTLFSIPFLINLRTEFAFFTHHGLNVFIDDVFPS